MSDFIMTLDSDDDSSSLVPTTSTSTSKQQLRKQQDKATTKQKQKATKKKRQQKSKKVLDVDLSDQQSSDEEAELNGVGFEGVGKMDKGFVFDGLGGGFVGDRRNNVWDSGEAYIQSRPNAMPRVTVDEIIARRAPEREAMKATLEAEALLAEEDDDEELEAEMMAELQGSEGEHEEEEEFKGIDSDDDQEDDGSDEEVEKELVGTEKEVENEQEKGEVVVDDEENWLGLGRVSDDEKEEDGADEEEEESDDESEVEEDESEVKAASSAFAALADMEDDDMSDSNSDSNNNEPSKASNSTTPTDSTLSKSFFTSHRNASASSSKSLSFNTLPNATLSRQLLLALGSLNLSTPTPIQSECIPLAMMGKDIVASSATGSGKTVAFWVGVLERLLHRDRKNPMTRVVVMTPTRELAVQVHGVGKALARYTDVQFCLCVGGLSLKVQEAELKQRPDIVVSTPGRLIDHVRNTPCFTMDGVEVLVLDEADRMLEE
ncbi:hypothetical protein JCM5353_000245, partial [Sporobolomyces roseus]